jgi:hypothetical protein
MQLFARLLGLRMMALCFSFGLLGAASAKEIPLIAPMSGFSLLDPTYPPGPGGPKPYSQTDGSLRWGVGPWHSPGGRMPPFSKQQDGAETVYSTRAPAVGVSVAISPTGTTLTLEQDGRVVPCTGSNNKTFEFDLFAKPNVPNVKAPRLSGYSRSGPYGPALSDLTGLMFGANVTMTQGLATSRKQCRVNFGNTVFAVILNDRSAHPSQVFFYQLFLSRFCGSDASVKLPACTPPKNMYQFFVKTPFGTDDYLPLAGKPWLLQRQSTEIQVDLLPRLISAIRTGRGGIDQNLSHWTVGSVYLGQIMYGDITLQSTWRDVSLVAQTH